MAFTDDHSLAVRMVILLALALPMIYGADYVAFNYKMAIGDQPFSYVPIRHYFAIHEKDNKVEYAFDKEDSQMCVNSWFPHYNLKPCWYVRRHAEVKTDI